MLEVAMLCMNYDDIHDTLPPGRLPAAAPTITAREVEGAITSISASGNPGHGGFTPNRANKALKPRSHYVEPYVPHNTQDVVRYLIKGDGFPATERIRMGTFAVQLTTVLLSSPIFIWKLFDYLSFGDYRGIAVTSMKTLAPQYTGVSHLTKNMVFCSFDKLI